MIFVLVAITIELGVVFLLRVIIFVNVLTLVSRQKEGEIDNSIEAKIWQIFKHLTCSYGKTSLIPLAII